MYMNLLWPSSGIESIDDLESREMWHSYYYDSSLQMNQAQICEIPTSVQVMRLDSFQPHKAYPILCAEELYVYGSEARILLRIWDHVFRYGYVILPLDALSQDDVNRINNYTLLMKLVYRGVDSSNNLVVDFIESG